MELLRLPAVRSVRYLMRVGGVGTILAAASVVPGPASAQTTPYVVQVISETYQPLPLNGGTATPLSIPFGDDDAMDAGVPFPVTFFDQSYTGIRAATNGYVVFPASQSGTDWINSPLPSSSGPEGIIAVWWDDQWCDQGMITTQTLGSAPSREHVVQFHCYERLQPSNTFQAQVWFTENSTTIKVKYGAIASSGFFSAAVGIEDHTGTIAHTPLPCGAAASCTVSNWNTSLGGKAVIYAQGPDMTVAAVSGVPVAYSGVTTHMEAVARNAGGEDSVGFGMRFWVSQDSQLGSGDIEVGTSPTVHDAAPGQSVTFTLDAPIPTGLTPGQYYLIAEVDPLDVVDEDTETNNTNFFGPFEIGLPAPDLIVESIGTPSGAAPGETFTFEWTAANVGNLIGADVPYAVMLSSNGVVSSSDLRIHTGTVTVDQLASLPVQEQIALPDDVNAGSYWIGVVIDPDNQVYELNDLNNEGVSGAPFAVAVPGLEILTTTLPPAEIGSLYCMQLRATGGDGTFTWSLDSGALPSGLVFEEERGGMPANFPVLATMLCGHPAITGTFDFSLQVQSGDLSAVQDYTLVVNESGMPLVVATTMVPQAQFQVGYEVDLLAVGGKAPYEWTTAAGALPPGLQLGSDGHVYGEPVVDGTYPVSVQVTDSAGTSVTAELAFEVTSPARLTCVSRTLPPSKVGEKFTIQLLAAGGTKPYSWSTLESRRLADSLTDAQTFLNSAPPGFLLAGDGTVTAEPLAAGKYIWQVEVNDEENNSPDGCSIAFEVSYDQGVSVATTALAAGFVDTPYSAQLQVGGAAGIVSWSLAAGSALPEGLQLSQDGVISGIVSTFVLEGEPSRTFSFVVQVRDVENRVNVAPLSITFHEAPQDDGGVAPAEPKESGCSAGFGDPGLLALGAVLVSLRVRRRR